MTFSFLIKDLFRFQMFSYLTMVYVVVVIKKSHHNSGQERKLLSLCHKDLQ